MATKKNQNALEKSGRQKVGDLKLNKETVKDLTTSDLKKIPAAGLKAATHTCDVAMCAANSAISALVCGGCR
jgi:hypothetical protein